MTDSLTEAVAKINPGDTVTLTDEERALGHPMHLNGVRVGLAFIQADVEDIIAAREQALREEIETLRLEQSEWIARYESLHEEIAGEVRAYVDGRTGSDYWDGHVAAANYIARGGAR